MDEKKMITIYRYTWIEINFELEKKSPAITIGRPVHTECLGIYIPEDAHIRWESKGLVLEDSEYSINEGNHLINGGDLPFMRNPKEIELPYHTIDRMLTSLRVARMEQKNIDEYSRTIKEFLCH